MSVVTIICENKIPSVGLIFPNRQSHILTLTNKSCQKIKFWYQDKEFLTKDCIKFNPCSLNKFFLL